MTPAHAIAELAALGLPAEKLKEAVAIIEAVVATTLIGEEERKAKDRARKAAAALAKKSKEQRGRDRNSAESIGTARNGLEAEKPESVVDIYTKLDSSVKDSKQQLPRSSKASRGTRLADDFSPHPNILEMARSRGFTDAEYWDHFQRFKDYWQALSGAKALKLDWNMTWRNRIKDLADRKGSFNGKTPQSSIKERFANIRARLGEQNGSDGSDQDRGEDSEHLSGLRQGAGRIPSLGH